MKTTNATIKTYDIINAGKNNRFLCNGRIVSNSGKLVQVQNLRKNDLKDLDLARETVAADDEDIFEMLFTVPDTLSQLIRTAFIAKPNYKFIVSDFAAIEARVIAWLAGEKWRLDVFNTHGKIYEASASQMFKVPLETISKGGINYHLRQKGKVAELACIAEGQLILTNKGFIPIENLTLAYQVFDGKNFVKHDGLIYKGIKKVIKYAGLTATSEHLVFIEGQSKPIQFGIAAACGAHITKAGTGWPNIRMGKNNQSRKKMEKRMAGSYGFNSMHKLPSHSMVKSLQFNFRKISRLPSLFATQTNTSLVRQKINSSKATLRKSERQKFSQLWRKGNKIQISKRIRSRYLDIAERAVSFEKIRVRQNTNKRTLRTRKYPIFYTKKKSTNTQINHITGICAGRMALQLQCSSTNAFIRFKQTANFSKRSKSSIRKTKKLESHKAETFAATYDILNCGPNNRFACSGLLVHNCGYQGGKGALIKMGALKMGLDEAELPEIIKQWRNANKKIVQLWYDIQNAAVDALEQPGSIVQYKSLQFAFKRNILFIKLPSGRMLSYIGAKLIETVYGNGIQYKGMNQTTKKWETVDTYGGKLVENIVQAIARDLLADSMLRLDALGYKIVMHVHDEIVMEEPNNQDLIKQVNQIMGEPVRWAPGLPLKAEAYETFYYCKKD